MLWETALQINQATVYREMQKVTTKQRTIQVSSHEVGKMVKKYCKGFLEWHTEKFRLDNVSKNKPPRLFPLNRQHYETIWMVNSGQEERGERETY